MSNPFWDWGSNVPTGNTYAANEWDVMTLGGITLPGIVEVKATAGRRVDEKKHSGSDGETLTFHGRNPARVDIRVRIWTPEQAIELEDALDKLWPNHGRTGVAGTQQVIDQGAVTKGATAALTALFGSSTPLAASAAATLTSIASTRGVVAFDISHPATQWLGIKSVVITEVTAPAPGSVVGEKVVTFKCIEYMPVTTNTAKPSTIKRALDHATATPALNGLSPGAKRQPAPDPSTNPSDIGPNFTPPVQNGSS